MASVPATSEQTALVRAILVDPTDDAPRLVLADWLDEHGRSDRAAVIRRQIAAGTETSFAGGSDRDGWFPGTDPVGDRAEFVVRRGFVCEIHLPVALFLAHAEALFRAHPITNVWLDGREPFEGSPQSYSWYRDGSVPPGGAEFHFESNLPAPLWDELSGYAQEAPGRAKWYESVVAARAACSRACVQYGRRLAGLPDVGL